MLLLGLFIAAPTQAQTPRLAAWHSHQPMNMNQEACFTRAQQALRAASFQNIGSTEGWNTSGTSTYLHAAISCVAMGDQTLVDVVVAGVYGYGSQTSAMRTRLSNYMRNGVGSGGGTGSDQSGGICSGGFIAMPGKYVQGNNHETINEATVAQCQQRCLQRDGRGGLGGSWYCKGFDWDDSNKDGIGVCHLSRLGCPVVGKNYCRGKHKSLVWYERCSQTTLPPDNPFVQLDPPSDNVSNWKIDYGPYEINGTPIDAKPAGDGKTSYYVAPDRYKGNLTTYKHLSFEKKSWGGSYYGPDSYGAYGDVVIKNGNLTARYDINKDHSERWKSYSIPLYGSGWKLSGGASSLRDVLRNVTALKIRAEYGAGTDYSSLRNVVLK